MHRDAEERKDSGGDDSHTQRETDLIASEETFRLIFENNSAAIAIIDFDTTISMVNSAYCAMSGYTKEEAVGMSWSAQIPPGDLARLQEYNRRRLANPDDAPVSYEFTFYHRGGEIRHGLMSVSMMTKARKIIASFTDITDRKRAEAELADAHAQISSINQELTASLAELQTRNEDLDAFSQTVAHDLRNSLNLVIGYAGFLEDGLTVDSPAVYHEAVHAVKKSGEKMMEILEELLLLSQVQAMEVQMTPLEMDVILQSVLDELSFQISHTRADITAPAVWPAALGYRPWIEAVWRNYIGNALKFGGDKPRIELSATVQQGEVHFRVRDHGIGIDEEQQAKLFHAFTRLRKVRTDGHGLGLSIVRRIVEKHGGRVSVASSGVNGEGSEFGFTLPAGGKE